MQSSLFSLSLTMRVIARVPLIIVERLVPMEYVSLSCLSSIFIFRWLHHYIIFIHGTYVPLALALALGSVSRLFHFHPLLREIVLSSSLAHTQAVESPSTELHFEHWNIMGPSRFVFPSAPTIGVLISSAILFTCKATFRIPETVLVVKPIYLICRSDIKSISYLLLTQLIML